MNRPITRKQKFGLLVVVLFLFLCLAACQTRLVETIREVEVTRVVTETVLQDGKPIEVTRLVTRTETVLEEVVVEVTVEPETLPMPVTLRWNWGAEPATLDPALAGEENSINAGANLFMGLTSTDPETGELLPGLATEWSADESGSVYTFKLRDDVPWVQYNPTTGEWAVERDDAGNERYVNAHDVVYGIRRSADPQTGSPYAYVLYNIAGALEFNSGDAGYAAEDVGVAALDDYTVEITLNNPAAYFHAIAGLWTLYPQPQWAIEQWGPKWTEAGLIVTNGRYGLAEWVHGGSLDLVKNPLHPEAGSTQIERIDGVMIAEESTAFAMYENDELDTQGLPLLEIDRVKADPQLSQQLVNMPVPCTLHYGFTNNKPPFDDVRVRQAFSQAIDRQSLVDNVTKGGEIPATSFAPPGIFGAPPPGEVGLGYDPDAAVNALRAYLDEQGITVEEFNTQGITLMHNTGESNAAVAAAIQQMWKDVLGVEVKIENQEWRVYLQTIRNPTPLAEMPHIWSRGWCADYADQNNWVFENFHVIGSANIPRRGCLDANCTQVEAAEFDELVQAAQLSQDPQERMELYYEAERILHEEEVAIAPLYHFTTLVMVKPWLARTFAPLGGQQFYTWTIDRNAQIEALGG